MSGTLEKTGIKILDLIPFLEPTIQTQLITCITYKYRIIHISILLKAVGKNQISRK